MNLTVDQRETLQRWLPILLVTAIVWIAARGVRRSFGLVFGVVWITYWTGGRFPFWH